MEDYVIREKVKDFCEKHGLREHFIEQDLFRFAKSFFPKKTVWIVHDMTGALSDKEFETEEAALDWEKHVTQWDPNSRPIIKTKTE